MDDQRSNCPINKLIVVLGLCISGCASVQLPDVNQDGFEILKDEHRVFNRANELNDKIDASGIIYQDPELEQYLGRVMHGLWSGDGADHIDLNVRVINDTIVNAYAMPTGRIYLNTSTLALMRNESQLASVLAHELTHIIERHALKVKRSTSNKAAWFNSLSMLTPITGIAAVSSITGYSKHVELQADVRGFKMMAMKGYNPAEGIVLFKRIKDYIKKEDIHTPLFFSSHPGTQARITNFENLLEEQDEIFSEMTYDQNEFIQRTRYVRLTAIRQWIKAGMFQTAHEVIDEYMNDFPEDVHALVFKASIFRKRPDAMYTKKGRRQKDPLDLTQALGFVDSAIEMDSQFSDAWYERGLILQKMGHVDEARQSYRKYLTLNPEADQREFLENYIDG